jgi:hypothetical protein
MSTRSINLKEATLALLTFLASAGKKQRKYGTRRPPLLRQIDQSVAQLPHRQVVWNRNNAACVDPLPLGLGPYLARSLRHHRPKAGMKLAWINPSKVTVSYVGVDGHL